MKVNAVSFGSKSAEIVNPSTNAGFSSPYIYLPADNSKSDDSFNHKAYTILTAIAAAAAVLLTILDIKGTKKISRKIVEVTDPKKGFNKINKYQRTIDIIKNKVLYPLKAITLGDEHFSTYKNLKSGFILSGNNPQELSSFMNAFVEHASELNIKCKTIPNRLRIINQPKNSTDIVPELKIESEVIEEAVPIRRGRAIKWVRKAIQEAIEHYKRTGEYSIINLGNLENLTNFHIRKGTDSSFDKLIKEVNKHHYPGVIWTAWTNHYGDMPAFYLKLPVVITSLMD